VHRLQAPCLGGWFAKLLKLGPVARARVIRQARSPRLVALPTGDRWN